MANFAIVGAGFVADFYMRSAEAFPQHTFTGVWDHDPERLSRFSHFWNVPAARGLEDLFAGAKRPDILINLTPPQSHYPVSRAALDAGLSVYSEKPLALTMDDAQDLAATARQKGVLLSSAPCNGLGAPAQAMASALRRRLIGTPHLVYAEMDDGYIPQAPYGGWVSESGAPWPAANEFATGATLEHGGYALAWLAALFGPVRTVSAFSATLIADKLGDGTSTAPDFSAALLRFDNNIVARLTHSIVATRDRRFRVFGSRGVLSADNIWNNSAKVVLARRNAVRRRLVEGLVPQRVEVAAPAAARARRRGPTMNYMLGPNDMAEAMADGRPPRLAADLALHLNELTLAIHHAGDGTAATLSTTFEPIAPMPWARPQQRRRAMDEDAIKLAIVGTGAMAATMCEALRHHRGFHVAAVTSDDLPRAEAFALTHEIEGAYGDLDAMLATAGVDAVYIANATPAHAAAAMASLSAGKATLVEKPLAMTPHEAERIIAAAGEGNALLMEALWTPFLPAHARAVALAKGGTLGEALHLSMEWGFPATAETAPRLFDRSAGGGVLLDRMIYPLGLALTLFGPIAEMDAAVTYADGIDTHASLQLRHAGGATSQLASSLVSLTANTATISCTGGLIRIEEPVLGAETLSVRTMGPQALAPDEPRASITAPPPGHVARAQLTARLQQSGLVRRVGRATSAPRTETKSYGASPYLPMLNHFAELIRGAKLESDIVTHALSLRVQRCLDAARHDPHGGTG